MEERVGEGHEGKAKQSMSMQPRTLIILNTRTEFTI